MSIKKQAIKYLSEMKEEYITHQELVTVVSNIKKLPYESVRGTLLISQDKIREICDKSNTVYIKNHKELGSIIVNGKFISKYRSLVYGVSNYTYETKNKKMARDYIYSHFDRGNILTFAGSEGKDIEHIIDNNLKYKKIYNLEKYKDEFDKYINDHPLSDKSININRSFYDFYSKNEISFDLINYDSVSYLSDNLSKDIILMNQKIKANTIAITLSKMENGVRNHGRFSDYLRKNYKKLITTNFLKDTLSAYKLIEKYEYQREKGSQPMIIYIFKLR